MSEKYVDISTDAFSRMTLIRKVDRYGKACAWCGNLNSYGHLFIYGYDSSGWRKSWESKSFCSKPCHDSYHS